MFRKQNYIEYVMLILSTANIGEEEWKLKYYISDLHLFHENAIAFDHRPFASLQEMHDTILKN